MYSHCRNGGWILGNTIDGTQAEYVLIPYADTSLYALPTDVEEEAAVMLSDILPTGFECGVLNGHVKPGDTPWVAGGLRDFFLYRDLGVADATGGRVLAQLVKANSPPEEGTGWHQHVADFHIVIMLKGWGHYEVYTGEAFRQVIEPTLAWYQTHLPPK